MSEGNSFAPKNLLNVRDGDVYLMRHILHDWGHEECLKILSNLKTKLQGKKVMLMIGECFIPDRDRVGVPSTMYKIDLQILNIVGPHAMERTPQQLKNLMEEVGFSVVAIHPARSLLHFIEAVPLPYADMKGFEDFVVFEYYRNAMTLSN